MKTNWNPRGSKNKKRINERFKQRQAREYLERLNKKDMDALRAQMSAMDEGLPPPPPELPITTWELMVSKGRGWLDKVRGNA